MSSGHKTATVFVATLSGLILLILGLVLGWPLWVWPLAAVLLGSAALGLVRATTPPVDPLAREFTYEPDLPIPPPERREQVVSEIALPTSESDYDFRFSATVRWHPLEAPADAPAISPGGLAVSAVLERARRFTALEPPHRGSLLQHRLNGELGVMLPDSTGRVLAMAENVTLTLSDADAQRLRKLSTVRKDEELWSHERKYECDRREYLGKDVLKDTGSAVVWWLTKNDDQIKKTVDDIGTLAQLTSAANNHDIPERFGHMVPYPVPVPEPELNGHGNGYGNGQHNAEQFLGADGFGGNGRAASSAPRNPADHFGALLESMGVPSGHNDGALLARYFCDTATHVGRDDAGSTIRRRFDPSAATPPDDGPGTGTDPEESEGPEEPEEPPFPPEE